MIFSQSDKFKITSNSTSIPLDENNIVHKAYQIFRTIYQPSTEYSIHIEKNIPIGSGLGGGSSNAASTLCALNKLWHANLSNKELIDNLDEKHSSSNDSSTVAEEDTEEEDAEVSN